jgi:hypothetical protein
MIPAEAQEQEVLCRWLDLMKLEYFAVPNGGSRHFLEGKNLKKQGVKKGVSDLVVFTSHKILFIEMKRIKKSVTSKEQIYFIENVKKLPYADGKICYGAKEAMKFIESHIR